MAGKVIERAAWTYAAAPTDRWSGEWEGGPHGAGISVIFNHTEAVGGGPRLHSHPYPETFIIRKGRARFTVGDEVFEAEAGQIVVAPANVPHKFQNAGPGPLENIDIHEAGLFETTWLE